MARDYVFPTSIQPQMEFSPGVWTDVSEDIVNGSSVTLSYGINGGGPLDRVAETGTARFLMKNDESNSGGLKGYYSPNHSNARSGFNYGTGFRIAITYDGVTYYKFRGRLTGITPEPGKFSSQRVKVVAADWMEDLARFTVRDIAPQVNQRADQVLTAVINSMPTDAQPPAQNLDAGIDTFPYTLYELGSGQSGRSVAQKLMTSELGYLVVAGDTTQGGTLRFLNRHHRAKTPSVLTMTENMTGLRVPSSLDLAFNRVDVRIHPTRVDSSNIVIWAMQNTPDDIRPLIVQGTTLTLWGDYFDPTNEDKLIGGVNQVTPVATTDYTMNSQQDGAGSDVTNNFTVTATFYASSVKLEIVNNGTMDGYVTFLRVRGNGIYDIAPLTFEAKSAQSYGERPIKINMPYQDNPNIGQGAADYLQEIYKNLSNQVLSISFNANHSDALMTAAMTCEPFDRLTFTEEMTGITLVDGFVTSISLILHPGNLMDVRWGLSPSAEGDNWILDDAVASLLGTSTVLGYV